MVLLFYVVLTRGHSGAFRGATLTHADAWKAVLLRGLLTTAPARGLSSMVTSG